MLNIDFTDFFFTEILRIKYNLYEIILCSLTQNP